jgi:hypothetical protein
VANEIVPTAKYRPGKCIFTGNTQGPFVDTGKTIPRYGRIYISVTSLHMFADPFGLISKDKVAELVEENGRLHAEVERLANVDSDMADLIETLSSYLPKPEPVIEEKRTVVTREPTDEEIQKWVEEKGGNHPAVLKARTPEKGSTEEWQALYGNKKKPEQTKAPEPEPTPEVVDEGPPSIVTLFGQSVDLDKLLRENVKTIVDFCESKPDEFVEALVERETWKSKDKPRVSLLAGLGYETEEEETE